MANATNSPGPVTGNPYAVIILTGGFDIERFSFATPIDAMLAGIAYLREGRQVRLSDRTCAALKETPELASYDQLLRLPAPPQTIAGGPVFKAALGG